MKTDRLIGIVIYLMKHGRSSARELAREFEVSSRTIMRDLDSLDKAGIPLQSFPGADGGYQLMEGYVLERQYATGSEYGWIVTALKGLATAYAGKEIQRTLDKLEHLGAVPSPTLSLDLSAACEDSRVNGFLQILEGAIARRHAVRFTYSNSRGETKDIHAEPVKLEYKWYNWYLTAYYRKHDDFCTFKLVRMDRLSETDTPCVHEYDPLSESRTVNEASLIHVRLLGKAPVRAVCREYLNGHIIREYDNGDFEYTFSVPEHEFFWFGAILSMGSDVCILEPPQLRERIINICKEVLNEYDDWDQQIRYQR